MVFASQSPKDLYSENEDQTKVYNELAERDPVQEDTR